MSTDTPPPVQSNKLVEVVSGITVRLAGDSGDGMQLLGTQLTNTSALAGNDVATFPDFPAEIRAPRGTRAGVSGFQVQFAAHEVHTPGDTLDALVAMNPAALVTNLSDLRPGGLLIVDEDSFEAKDLKLANLSTNPLEEPWTENYRLAKVPMTKLTRTAVAELGLSMKEADRCRNFFAMGMVYWLYGRDMDATMRFIKAKFSRLPEVQEANERALKAGWAFGETTELLGTSYQVEKAELPPGKYRNIMGNQALAWGLMTAANLSKKELFYGSYPITPASDILHELCKFKNYGVCTVQAEDEIAAVCAAIGAAYGGSMAVTTSSGPGIALKAEAMGLAVMIELPLLVINVQRGGPSTGLPTKTEQADLLQMLHGRNGEAPIPVLAAQSPGDCFDTAIEAWRIATQFMVPVVILSDGYIANGAEPWRVPDIAAMDPISIEHPTEFNHGDEFWPYARDRNLARPWAIPGTPNLMHRVGGLEKQDGTGNVSYDPDNHEKMVKTRAQKVANIARVIPPQKVNGPESGELLVLSWGGTYGACHTAVTKAMDAGLSVAHCHLRHMNPFPANLGEILSRYEQVLVPELNMGQLRMLIRDRFLVDAIGYNKVQGKPFSVSELLDKICEMAATESNKLCESKAG
ncbi:2-oxoacid:acceptor oxidoreductase subunit alpha [Aureliella helgolandensis]|uniref:2-oxoglutarate oxidoreductase subunit KorA n=1 Tax=Aureliella helgolandensis TaxID=2527968 RepID=A0A518GC72_9BACT|nr:2-oxoacid:acceptor oxidoreductase subunit alpha [Aureliella helgolandensis]QDV26195.1 2-oxoglutarate oxidoreductase subunit KorA [Aureliella helgolandensis]